MGSSGSSNVRAPTIPSPPGNLISSPGSTAGGNIPSYPSFLPSVPGQMATGLTPEMMQQISASVAPPAAPPAAAASAPSTYQQMLSFLGSMGGGGLGQPMGGGIRGGGLTPFGRAQGAARNNYGLPTIPAPTAGAGGMINPADLAAYQAAQSQQDQMRGQLAKQMQRQMRNQRVTGRNR